LTGREVGGAHHGNDILDESSALVEEGPPEVDISVLDPSTAIKQPEYPFGEKVPKLL